MKDVLSIAGIHFLILANFNLIFEFLAAILEKGLFAHNQCS